MKTSNFLLILPILLLLSCGESKPVQVKLNVDNCDYCKMTIADAKFAAELITAKGRIYKFDDISCLKAYNKENPTQEGVHLYVANFEQPNQFLAVGEAVFVLGEEIGSPMGGNLAAFATKESAEKFSSAGNMQIVFWNDIQKQ